jgi:formylmethanofuran dehydrogenase subunit D
MHHNNTQKYLKGTVLLVIALTITFALTVLNAQTKTTHEILVKARMNPESYGLKHILLMNPGDMGKFGLKGGEEVRVCRKYDNGDSSRDCVIVRVEYGAGVVSGTVMMDVGELNALRLLPGDTFLMELSLL